MKWFIIPLLLFIGCQSSSTPSDSTGRIISLSPHITEIIYALGAQDQLLAVSDFCIYPPEAAQKQHIGGLLNPNIEQIIALKPFLLIGVPAHQDLAPKLHGISLVLLPNETISDIMKTIDTLGVITGKYAEAEKLVETLKDTLATFKGMINGTRSMIVIGRDEGSPKNITVAGPGSFISEIWLSMGGVNVFDDLNTRYATVSHEAILMRDPEWIIEFRHLYPKDGAALRRINEEWQTLSKLQAVKGKNIFLLTGDYVMIPGPRLYLLACDFKRILEAASGLEKEGVGKNVNKM